MGTEVPKTQDSSGGSDSNSHSDSENSDSCSYSSSGSEWACGGDKPAGARKPHFSVTSCDTGLKLKIAAIKSPRKNQTTPKAAKTSKTTPTKKPSTAKDAVKAQKITKKKTKSLSDTSSSSNSCSNCTSDSSSDDDLPLQAVTEAASKRNLRKKPSQPASSTEKAITEDSASEDDKKLSELDSSKVKSARNNVKKTISEVTTPPKRGRGRPRTKFAATSPVAEEVGCEAASSSSSSSSSSGSSSASSSDSDTADTAAGGSANVSSADDSSAALVAACSLQVIDEEDLAAILPEQLPAAAPTQPAFPVYPVHATPPRNDDKSIADTGDGSSSEMELPPQLVTAAIQRATADSSGSDNECSNSAVPHQTGGHYASSLLQQFVAQTQLLSHSTPMTPIGGTVNPVIGCNLRPNPIEAVGINDCVLGQINTLPEINPIAPSFLTSDHLSDGNNHHLSPQQTEELSQINKDLDLEEITSTVSSGLSIPNPPSLDDCVDNNDFMTIDITQTGIGSANDLLKTSPLTVISADMTPQNQIDAHKLDTVSTNSIESQEDVKMVVDVRKKRGRPRKVREEPKPESREEKSNNINDFCHNNDPPNVSPDSGILSNHNSPTHSPLRRHDVDVSHRVQKKSPLKENRHNEKRSSRSKSKSRMRRESDSSECDYRVREIRQIKTEAPSPIPLKQEQPKPEKPKKQDHKLDIAALDRMLYATDRVLYPPRRKNNRQQGKNTKRNSGKTLRDKSHTDSGDSDVETRANRSVLSEVYAKRKDLNNKLASLPKKGNSKNINTSWRDHQSENEGQLDDPLDPTWRQIDLNPKYKDILSGYKSDHEIKPYKSCSRLMESGYKSDYGCRSGYRSDCFRSGYKSDHKSGYKSDKSGYKTDHSVRNIRRRMRKLKKSRSVRDRTYYKNQKHFVSDQEILILANKTFSCLTLGHSTGDSDSDVYSCKNASSPKFVSVSTKYPSLAPSYNFGFSCLNNKKKTPKSKINSKDPFAPGPVFSGLGKQTQSIKFAKVNIFKSNTNNNMLIKSSSKANYLASPLPATAFTHKFGCAPISVASKMTSNSKKNANLNNNTMKQLSRNLSPKNRKRNSGSVSPKLVNVFEKSRNAYVPNKSLARNVFLNLKKPLSCPTLQIKKHKRPVVLAPPKINLKPTERLSRISLKTEPRHHRHKSKKRHRSRSASKCRDRETYTKTVDTIDQKFTQEMDNLVSNFIKLCQIAPKLIEKQPVKNTERREEKHKELPEVTTTKCVKRGSKKRKTSDNLETSTPTTKRRHKKQLAESQTKGGKEATSANEHKLPLKKRHYHINSSTSNPLSLSLVSAEFDENAKIQNSQDKFLCTETNCMGNLQSVNESTKPKDIKGKDKKTDVAKVASANVANTEKNPEEVLKSIKSGINTTVESLTVQIDEAIEACISRYTSPNSAHATDDELSIKKPVGEHSELSKKIYETSEKLKAVHKMVHDLEKSLPKTKESEIKLDNSKTDAHKASSPKVEPKVIPSRNSAPIVTPKKRHRLEADKIISNSSLDQVVQSLSKKLSEEKSSASEAPKTASPAHKPEEINLEKSSSSSPTLSVDSNTSTDPLKTMSVRTLCKSSILPAQKSEIMTRKKNRLEGLTSNLVSKINPSTATKMLDTLLNNNIRKSIESRILEKDKNNSDVAVKIGEEKIKSKETSHMNTRATVIKSPISKGKLPSEAKKLPKGTDILLEQTVVVNVDKPTGIFEPSVDLELQIPKSSISLNTLPIEKTDSKSKVKLRSSDNKSSSKCKPTLDLEGDIPLSLISETTETTINRPRRSDSIASVISDKIQETASGHNLRQKRNLTNDADKSSDEVNEKKKKKVGNNILRESKLVLPSQMMQPKVQAEKVNDADIKKPATDTNAVNPDNKNAESPKKDITIKKRPKRRAINRTGFPSVKKKKKKLSINQNNSQTDLNDQCTSDSAFERVPKLGEATYSFLERTTLKKPNELKVVLNKEDCPRQGRLSVISLERLQGKELLENNNTLKKSEDSSLKNAKLLTSVNPTVTIQQLRNSKIDKDQNPVSKWEILSETDSIPSLVSSFGNDPEDSIPLSLLNLKPERPSSQMDRVERLKRKTHELSPSQEVEDIILSKRRSVDKNQTRLRSKSSLAMLCPSDRRLTRSTDTDNNDKVKKCIEKKKTVESVEKDDITAKPDRITARRKSRSYQAKKIREIRSSSRDSSLDTLKSLKLSPKSRETSVDTIRRDHCFENDPLPLNEKEIDFEKSIDVISKNVICKKRMASSRDDSPASSCERNKNDRDKPAISKRNPRLRKKFLGAGLFSDYYKENDPKPLDAKAKSLISQTDFPTGLLAPPPYCERWVRQRKQHFQLPYDIWWQHQYNQPVPSWNYKKIRSNVYYDVKPSADECESVACNCVPSSGCPEECINRLVFAECSPQLCPCKERCKNQRIQKHEWSSGLERFMTVHKGWGVRTNNSITSGDFILEYVGEVVSDKEFKERMASRYARDTHHYCLHLDGGLVIDGHRMGGDGRFVNHSCRPNCEMQKWTANGTFRMALFALRDIEPGEELTYDYNFSLFNPAEGQPCKCDSENCRGVIGGKSQRITKPPPKTQRTTSNTSNQSSVGSVQEPTTNRVGRPRKSTKCNKKCDGQQTVSMCDLKNYQQHLSKLWQEPQVKPLTAREKAVVRDRHCFLFRNLEKVRKMRDSVSSPNLSPPQPAATDALPSLPVTTNINPLSLPSNLNALSNVNINPSVFLTRLQALRAPRNIKTRRLAQVEDNPELSKQARLANVFRELYNVVVDAKDEENKLLCSSFRRRKDKPTGQPTDPTTPPDLSTIEMNIESGHYKTVGQLDADVNGVLNAVWRDCGRQSGAGVAARQLRKVYNNAKMEFAEQLIKILGPNEPLPPGFIQKSKPEEVIMCICGLHFEEGLMVQCGGAGCGVWQHARCMQVTDTGAPHHCHKCQPRPVDLEIPLDEFTDEGHQFYLSLMRGDLQIRQGDTVYVLRDIPIGEKHPDKSVEQGGGKRAERAEKGKRVERKKCKKDSKKEEELTKKTDDKSDVQKHTYKTIGEIPVSELDIFRVERLWKHKDTGERFVYGHHYLRPHETYHEPTRKFFPNEVMRVPLYEAVPIDLVMSQCWVMDVNTYCKGRPAYAIEEHVYICELRVDRTARLFTKVSRPKYPICTKTYAFDHFPQRIKISRTYAPHEVSPEYLKGRAGRNANTDKDSKGKAQTEKSAAQKKTPASQAASSLQQVNKNRDKQKERLNRILVTLLSRSGCRQPLDVSYLLDGRRQRKKNTS